MTHSRHFEVFGEPVEILINSSETHESFAVLTQISPPGGGPPPHTHLNEDEIFTVIEGEYEIFDGTAWHPLHKGETAHTLRGSIHTFRNCGQTPGKLQAVIVPGTGMDKYLEEISVLQMPRDAEQLMEISGRYGITFASPEPPTAVPL